jgi:hypothetical protein
MNDLSESRRRFLKATGLSVGTALLHSPTVVAESSISTQTNDSPTARSESASPDYTLHIKTSFRTRYLGNNASPRFLLECVWIPTRWRGC